MSISVGSLVVSAGFSAAGIALYQQKQARRELAWLQLPGIIVSSNVGWSGGYHSALVQYEFQFQGRILRSSTLRSSPISVNWPSVARRTASRYPVGANVVVFVDPANPSISVLEPGGDRKYLPFMLGLSGIAVAMGISLIVKGDVS